MKNKRILANGIEISNDTRVTGLNNNDLIIGSSGSGKTGGYVIPNLQNLTDSIVVSDTKGQLTKMFTKSLKSRGCCSPNRKKELDTTEKEVPSS